MSIYKSAISNILSTHKEGKGLNLKKLLLALVIVAFAASSIFILGVKAEDEINDYDNVLAEQVINDINSTVNSGLNEGEIKYDQNYTLYRLTVMPKSVTVGQQVTAIAETDNKHVTHVTFVWVKAFDGIRKIETVPVYLENGLKKAESTYNPDERGSWWVFALFEQRYVDSCKCGWLFAMRWACFRVTGIQQQVPDYPVVGTAGAVTSMLVSLSLFLNKKKQKPI